MGIIDVIAEELEKVLGPAEVRKDEPMSAHTSFRCGGKAAVFAAPKDEAALIACLRLLARREAPYFLLGNGSNVLVCDGGYPGVVLSAANALTEIRIEKNGDRNASDARSGPVPAGSVTAGAGVPLSALAKRAAAEGLSGLEPLSGIPGTLGGAVRMNAGAYGAEIADFVTEVEAYDLVADKNILLPGDLCDFSYRRSGFQEQPGLLVLRVRLALPYGDPEENAARIREFAWKRGEKQPVELPSAGSFFKRPSGDYAARLIEEAGLKGYSVGGAEVSRKHAGFIVNTGGATAADVLAVAAHVRITVSAKFGILLEEEPEIIGVYGGQDVTGEPD